MKEIMNDPRINTNRQKDTAELITKILQTFDITATVDRVLNGYQVDTYWCSITNDKTVADVAALHKELQLALVARSVLVTQDESSAQRFSLAVIINKGKWGQPLLNCSVCKNL